MNFRAKFNPFKKLEVFFVQKAISNKKGTQPFKDKKTARIIQIIEIILITPFAIGLFFYRILPGDYFINSELFLCIGIGLVLLVVLPGNSIFRISESWLKRTKTIEEAKAQKTILFLRSFNRDHLEDEWEKLILSFFDAKPIALGNPSEYFEPLGIATRIYLEEDEDWKEKIKELAEHSEGLIIRIDERENLMWEIENLVSYFRPSHIILYALPTKNKIIAKKEYDTFRESASIFFKKGLPEYTKQYRSLIIGFDDSWNPVVLNVPPIICLIDSIGRLSLNGLGDNLIMHSQIRKTIKENLYNDIEFFVQVCYNLGVSLFRALALFFVLYMLFDIIHD